ncbi:PREDICTED: NEDD4-binding protein 2-like [Elephantulus edwardii]|uniref:NEDD4-binding protein 2-like n=1 Tax=Elephantulus edwardii TaxID=28737 RepID=UPI0003F09242|nr:PREDICTED: NEDD4-binding protein 2-like [Elephantulus edwardii]
MPRRRKNRGSLSQKTAGSQKVVVSRVASNVEPATTLPRQPEIPVDPDNLVTSISEMFSTLDPDVVYMVLSECDFKVENAMDSLLELSASGPKKEETFSNSLPASEDLESTAENKTMRKCPGKEWEDSHVDAALDILLTQEFDSLPQRTFEPFESSAGHLSPSWPLQDVNSLRDSSEYVNSASGSSSPVLLQQNPDLTKEITENSASALNSNSLTSQSVSNECQHSLKDDILASEDKSLDTCLPSRPLHLVDGSIVDYSNLKEIKEKSSTTECIGTQFSQGPADGNANKPHVPLNLSAQNPQLHGLGTDGNKNFFAPYMLIPSDGLTVKLSTPNELSPKEKGMNYSPVLAYVPILLPPYATSLLWNPVMNTFNLFQGNHGFVTPVVTTPAHWNPVQYIQFPTISQTFQTSGWKNKDGTSAYQVQGHSVSPAPTQKIKSYSNLVLILLRGLPGSGKSSLARALQKHNPGGVVLSTDDYFYINGQYQFDVKYVKEAHEWNEQRAKEAFEKKISPIIIDNTNLQAWEMKPYVALSQKHKYKVIFREPETWWKFKPRELARRTVHGLSKEKLARMLELYQCFVSVSMIMHSSVPDETQCMELCAYSSEDNSTSSKDNEDTPSAEEGSILCSPLKHLQLKEEKKPEVTSETVTPENASALLCVDLDKRNKGKKKKQSDVNQHIQGGSDMSFSDSGRKMQVTDKSKNEEQVEMTSEKQHNKTDVGSLVQGIVSIYQDEMDPARSKPFDNEKPLPCKVPEERVTVQKNPCGKQNGKLAQKLPTNERSNYFGDWPVVTKTVSQRMIKNLTSSSDQSNKMYNWCQSFEALDDSFSLNVECTQQEESPQDSKEGDKSQGDDASEFSNCCRYDTWTNTETFISNSFNDVGDWPLFVSLPQRQPRSRSPKSHFNEPDGIGDNMSEMPLYTYWSTSPEELKALDCSTPRGSEMLYSEMGLGNKMCLSEKNHEQWALCLSSTNNLPVVPRVVEPQLLEDFLEEEAPGVSEAEADMGTQTEPQDFALLWKMDTNTIMVSESMKVLIGSIDGPESLNMNAEPDVQEPVPCRVMRDKSTCVEESQLMDADESENLNILCKIFASISPEVLSTLYERCNRDIVWTTSLLLDSENKLWEAMVFNSFQILKDESQTGPFSQGLDLKEIIRPKETFEGSNSSVHDCKHGINVSNAAEAQPACNRRRENSEQAAIKSLIPSAVGDWENPGLLPNSHGAFPDLYSSKLSFAGVLDSSVPKDGKEMEKTLVTAEVGDSTRSSNLFRILSPASGTSHLELNEGICFTDPFELERNDSHSEDSAEFQLYTEKIRPEDNQGMETIPRAGDSLSAVICEKEKLNPSPSVAQPLGINCLELALPPEAALQLCELFGSVGINIESLTVEDCVVNIDLNLAKVIHEKWKESIMERQCQQEIACGQLVPGPSFVEHVRSYNPKQESTQRRNEKLLEASAPSEMLPAAHHWNVQNKKVSLREIMSEEIAIQERENLRRTSLMFEKDFATKLKEKQLFKQFPTINQNFLADIFQDHNYCLEQTLQFLNCVLDEEPVKTVVAQDFVLPNENASSHTAQKSKEKKARRSREVDETTCDTARDVDYPAYDDHRAEAFLHQQKRMQCYSKAKEAYQMGRKSVAAFYAEQGRLHEQKMKEANHLAAVEIFEKVNSSLLPQNVLDLHGLHVDEAIAQLTAVLQRKSKEFRQSNNGKPYLSVITGRGNHSLGGVARIKPAVANYLTSHGFRFSEIKPGFLKVMLK